MAVPGAGVGITERVANVTIARWAKEVSEQTTQKYVLLKKLEAKGRIKGGQHGGELRWPVRFRDHDLQGHIDGAPKQFERVKTTFNANLEWRGYEVSDAITLREKAENGGEEAIVKIFAQREKTMREGAFRQLSREWFKDGDLPANSAKQTWHGIESFMATSGAQTASDELATTLGDTYAGTSTGRTSLKAGAVKGTDEEFGVWSPVVVSTNKDPGTGKQLWSDFADEYIRLGLIEAAFGTSMEEQTDLILLKKQSYRELLNIADDKERINFVRGEDVDVVKLGFTGFVELDGCAIGWDFGVPDVDDAGRKVHGYGFNCDRMWLKLLGQGGLWNSRVTWNDDYAATRIYLYSLGNLQFESPRHFIKFVDLVP